MRFILNSGSGQPLYAQLVQQVRHAVDTGVLHDGDLLPSIRALAEELAVGNNTVVKAYDLLAAEGLIELRQGSGAFVTCGQQAGARAKRMRDAQRRVRSLVAGLQADGLTNEEIQRLFEAEVWFTELATRGR